MQDTMVEGVNFATWRTMTMKKVEISMRGERSCKNMNKDMEEEEVVCENILFSHRR